MVYPWAILSPVPGHAIQMTSGRLIVPFWLFTGGGKEFGPNNNGRHRTNHPIRMSYDEGLTWPVSGVIDQGIAGYSDLTVTPDGIIHFFYEGGSISGTGGNHFKNTYMSIVSFDRQWLTNGKDQEERQDLQPQGISKLTLLPE